MKYGEPWTALRISHLVAPGSAGGAEFLDDCERRAVACVNACAGLDLSAAVPAGALAELVATAKQVVAALQTGWGIHAEQLSNSEVARQRTALQQALDKLA